MGILARMQRDFSETNPELMDLPNQDENALRSDLENLARLNRTFGGKKAVETVFRKLADKTRPLLLIDLAAVADFGNMSQAPPGRLVPVALIAAGVIGWRYVSAATTELERAA